MHLQKLWKRCGPETSQRALSFRDFYINSVGNLSATICCSPMGASCLSFAHINLLPFQNGGADPASISCVPSMISGKHSEWCTLSLSSKRVDAVFCCMSLTLLWINLSLAPKHSAIEYCSLTGLWACELCRLTCVFALNSIGITEKGSATVKLSVSVPPGHSSMPQRETCIGILASAVSRWERPAVFKKTFQPMFFLTI